MKKIPIEMIGDIVKTFLVGIPIELITTPDWIYDSSFDIDLYIERKDIMSIRSAIVGSLRNSKMESLIDLAKSMEVVFKEIKQKEKEDELR